MTTPDAFVVREGTTGSFVATDSITTGLTTSHYQYVKSSPLAKMELLP